MEQTEHGKILQCTPDFHIHKTQHGPLVQLNDSNRDHFIPVCTLESLLKLSRHTLRKILNDITKQQHLGMQTIREPTILSRIHKSAHKGLGGKPARHLRIIPLSSVELLAKLVNRCTEEVLHWVTHWQIQQEVVTLPYFRPRLQPPTDPSNLEEEEELEQEQEEEQEVSDASDTTESDEEYTESGKPTTKSTSGILGKKYGLTVEESSHQLLKDLTYMREFYSMPIHFGRQQPYLEETSLSSMEKLNRQFLGYLFRIEKECSPDLHDYLDLGKLQRFMEWLLNTRGLAPQTVQNHLTAAIGVLKYFAHAEADPSQGYADVFMIATLRNVIKQVRKLKNIRRPPTADELAKMQKWLPWEDIVCCLKSLKSDIQATATGSLQRAKALMEYIIVGLYVFLPPVRAGPIRELELNTSVFLDRENNKVTVDLRKHKTRARYEPVIAELCRELVPSVLDYVAHYWEKLKRNQVHQFLFVNQKGSPFSSSGWSSHVQSIFQRKTGQRIGNNLIRDSFVTYVYGKGVTEELKESLAEFMGHTTETAQEWYYRAPGTVRRQAGVDFTTATARQIMNTPGSEESESMEELQEEQSGEYMEEPQEAEPPEDMEEAELPEVELRNMEEAEPPGLRNIEEPKGQSSDTARVIEPTSTFLTQRNISRRGGRRRQPPREWWVGGCYSSTVE